MTQENFSKYLITKPNTKKQSAQLTSSNSIVGDFFKYKIDTKTQTVSILNKFDYKVSEISGDEAKEIILFYNKGCEIKIILSYVAFCEEKANHIAEFLIIAYNKKNNEAYKNFIKKISKQISAGNRPKITLDKFENNKIIETDGNWKPDKKHKPKLDEGCVIVKGKKGFIEKIIEAGRNKNPGCFIGSILFIVAVLAMILWPIKVLIWG